MSIGNLKDSGNLGNNFPWQLKMLQGLQSIYDEVKKPLTCLEDSVNICSPLGGLNVNMHDGSGNPITSTTIGGDTGLDVNIVGGVTLEVNLDPDNDAVGMYGYTDINDPLNPTALLVNSFGQLDIRPLTCADKVSLCFNDGVSDVTVSSTNPLPVNAIVTVPNLNCSTDSVAICDGAGNALAIDSNGSINSNLYAQDAGTGLQQPVSLTALGTANALDVYLQGPKGVQADCVDAISTALCKTQQDILTDIKTAAQNGTAFLRTTGMIRPNNVSGNVNTEPGATNFYSVSVANVGTNDGTILGGVTIKSGEVLNFSADAVNNYFNSFAYNATGTEFIIIFVY